MPAFAGIHDLVVELYISERRGYPAPPGMTALLRRIRMENLSLDAEGITLNVQIIKTPAGDEMVLLSRAEYVGLLDRLEELEEDAADAEAARSAKACASASPDRQAPRVVTPDEMRGHFLRARRKAAGVTQVELAARTGFVQGHISDLEAGRRRPSAEAFEKIADALGVSEEIRAKLYPVEPGQSAAKRGEDGPDQAALDRIAES